MNKIEKKDLCKLNLDLWMHHNNIMLGRLNILWFCQLGFLTLASYLSRDAISASIDSVHNIRLAELVCWVAAAVTLYLCSAMHFDRQIRDTYRDNIEKLGIGIYPGSLTKTPIEYDHGTRFSNAGFVLLVACIFIVLDITASYLFSRRSQISWVYIGIGIFIFLTLAFVAIKFEKKFHQWINSRGIST